MPALDYRSVLRETLLERVRRNARYSARAFARDLGISPAFLSQVLRHQKSLNEERAFKIASRLKLPAEASHRFLTLVRFDNARDEGLRRKLWEELGESDGDRVRFTDLSLDAFHAVSRWYHYAILELTQLPHFRSSASWVARKLGLTPLEAELAIDRLLRLGLLVEKDGRWTKAHANYSTNYVPSEAIRSFHHQMCTRAAEAVWEQDVASRDFSGITLALDPDRIPQAREKILRFRRELMAFLESGEPKAVYHLGIQLFRLDRSD